MNAAVAFAAHLAALARAPDVGDPIVASLLGAVVQDWTTLADSETPSFEWFDGALWVGTTPVRPSRPTPAIPGTLEASFRAHGVGGVRLVGGVDESSVVALLRLPQSVPTSAPLESAQRWLDTHGGRGALVLLPPRTPSAPDTRDAIRPTLHAWAAVVGILDGPETRDGGASLHGAVRALIEAACVEPRALPVALAFAGPGARRRPVAVATLALVLGMRLRLPRGALVDLVMAAIDACQLPPAPSPDVVARALARQGVAQLGLADARRVVTLWGLASLERPPARRVHLHARIVAFCDQADALLRGEGPGSLLPDAAIAQLQSRAGREASAPLVDALVSCLGRYPIGSTMVLDTGEVGVVCRAPASAENVARPVVRVVIDRNGDLVGGGPLVDLAQPSRARTRIVATVDPARLGVRVSEAILG